MKAPVHAWALAVALCLLLTLAAFLLLLHLTRWNLEALSQVPPLGWETAILAWTYALAFTLAVFLLLLALAVILFIASLAVEPDA